MDSIISLDLLIKTQRFQNSISLFPNPAEKGKVLEINISVSYLGAMELQVINTKECIIWTKRITKDKTEWVESLCLKTFDKGLYILKVKYKEMILLQRFIIE